MHTTHLRKVGGSVMLTIPPVLLDVLHLSAGNTVGLIIENGQLIIKADPKPHYSLQELLAVCDSAIEYSTEDIAWLSEPPIGNELL